MAITRTAWTDDDGSGTTGTVINNAEKTALYDQIDAMSHGHLLVDQVDITSTGTVNNHNPGGVTVRCNNATALTITGRAPYADGEIAIYENVGTSTVTFTDQGAGSTAANRFLMPVTSGQIIGPSGAIGFKYDGTSDRWRVIFVRAGTAIAYTPTWTNGTIGNGTLTGRYRQDGGLVWVDISVTMGSTSTFGAGSVWAFSLPMTAAGTTGQVFAAHILDSGTAFYIGAAVPASTTTISIYTNGASSGVTSAVPMTWAQNDVLRITGSFVPV